MTKTENEPSKKPGRKYIYVVVKYWSSGEVDTIGIYPNLATAKRAKIPGRVPGGSIHLKWVPDFCCGYVWWKSTDGSYGIQREKLPKNIVEMVNNFIKSW